MFYYHLTMLVFWSLMWSVPGTFQSKKAARIVRVGITMLIIAHLAGAILRYRLAQLDGAPSLVPWRVN